MTLCLWSLIEPEDTSYVSDVTFVLLRATSLAKAPRYHSLDEKPHEGERREEVTTSQAPQPVVIHPTLLSPCSFPPGQALLLPSAPPAAATQSGDIST